MESLNVTVVSLICSTRVAQMPHNMQLRQQVRPPARLRDEIVSSTLPRRKRSAARTGATPPPKRAKKSPASSKRTAKSAASIPRPDPELVLGLVAPFTDPHTLLSLSGVSRWVRESALLEIHRRVDNKISPLSMPRRPHEPSKLWDGKWLTKTQIQQKFKVPEKLLIEYGAPSFTHNVMVNSGEKRVLATFYPREWAGAVALAEEGTPRAWMKKHSHRKRGAAAKERQAKVKKAFEGEVADAHDLKRASAMYIRNGKGGIKGIRAALETAALVRSVPSLFRPWVCAGDDMQLCPHHVASCVARFHELNAALEARGCSMRHDRRLRDVVMGFGDCDDAEELVKLVERTEKSADAS